MNEVTMKEIKELIDDLADTVEDLTDKNIELIDICKAMWDFYCVLPDEPHTDVEELNFSVKIWKRMREIGVFR